MGNYGYKKIVKKKLKDALVNPDNKIIVSAISLWEISLKSALGKLKIKGLTPENLPELCKQIGFDIKSLSSKECSTYHKLKATCHKDPFDRMLIWQAISNDYILITTDADVKKYVSEGLRIF